MTVALQQSLKSGRLIPPVPFFFPKIALAIRGFLYFHTNCEIICSSSVKNTVGSLIGIPLNLQIARAPDLSALLHASNFHWLSVLHMVIYMFQCYSLKSSHPRLLPHSPKVCSLHLCLFCYFAYRETCIITYIITVFLNYEYMYQYTVLVFLFLT